jgi:hypothetical protein
VLALAAIWEQISTWAQEPPRDHCPKMAAATWYRLKAACHCAMLIPFGFFAAVPRKACADAARAR